MARNEDVSNKCMTENDPECSDNVPQTTWYVNAPTQCEDPNKDVANVHELPAVHASNVDRDHAAKKVNTPTHDITREGRPPDNHLVIAASDMQQQCRQQQCQQQQRQLKMVSHTAEQLRQNNNQLREEKGKLSRKLAENKDIVERLLKQNEAAFKEVESLTREVSQYQKSVPQKDLQINKLRQQLDSNNAIMKQLQEKEEKLLKEKEEIKVQVDLKQNILEELNTKYKTETEEHAAQVEHLKSHLDESTSEVKQLQVKSKQQSNKIASLQNKTQELSQKIAQCQVELKQKDGEIARKDKFNVQLQDQLVHLKSQHSDLEKRIRHLSKENQEMSQRLSEEWSQKVSSDESCIENISIKNRPMNIATEYDQLCSNQWLEIKTEMDEIEGVCEEDKHTLLCDLMLKAEKIAMERYNNLMSSVISNIMSPLKCSTQVFKQDHQNTDQLTIPNENESPRNFQTVSTQTDFGTHNVRDSMFLLAVCCDPLPAKSDSHESSNMVNSPETDKHETVCDVQQEDINKTKDSSEEETDWKNEDTNTDKNKKKDISIPDHLNNVIGDMLRTNADSVKVTAIMKELLQFAQQQSVKCNPWLSALVKSRQMKCYLEACSRITWKMTIQRPSMVFSDDGVGWPWDEKTQEPAYGSDDPKHSESIVMYYICPQLLHANKLMVKGKVMIKKIK